MNARSPIPGAGGDMQARKALKHTCIVCPRGCSLEVRRTSRGLEVRGNRCPRGEEYAREETVRPCRMLTAVIASDSLQWPCVPVKTERAVPRESIPAILEQLSSMRAALPVKCGGVAAADAGATGVALLFTRSLPPRDGE